MGNANSKPDGALGPILAIVLTGLALSFGDSLVRMSSENLSLAQIFVLRSLLALLGLSAVLLWMRVRFLPVSWGWVALRPGALVLMWVAYYQALTRVPFALAAAGYYTLPIFIALLSSLIARKPLGWVSWGAIFLGFLGVLLIVKPTQSGADPYLLLPLFAAFLYAVAMVLTGMKLREEHPLVLTFWLNVAFVAVGLIWLFQTPVSQTAFEQNVELKQFANVVLMAAVMVLATFASAYAYQRGPSAVIRTFDYGYLVFALFWGWLFFEETIDAIGLLGVGFIVLAGVIMIWRRG
ncbi:MAG: DMT family transporter [Pseudomonadota bacterium]